MELSHTDVEGVWQKDGIRVKPNNQWRVSNNGRVHGLTLSNLTLEDTGTIVFSAEGVRTTARLTVKGKPRPLEMCEMMFLLKSGLKLNCLDFLNLPETPVSILKMLSDVRVEEDFPATLECEFSRQIIEVKWFKVRKHHDSSTLQEFFVERGQSKLMRNTCLLL